ncbi:MAG TPA: DUF6512 family protein [Kiritimatiellia bacterium]|nr:DUF6512 family protein [Kiritimatiellia bacterium]HPS08912.1 DUF6512 family protein [Kiritimatiellia bacterium]
MSESWKRRSFLSALTVIFVGSFLHFAWELSGRVSLVAVFAAVNESTWEHLKLAFWPTLALTPFQRRIYGPLPGWLPATAIRCTLPSFLIVALFYGYTALLGPHHFTVDIAIFACAVFAGEWLGHAALYGCFGSRAKKCALGLLLLEAVLFSTLTFRHPDFFLFHDPKASVLQGNNRGKVV